jgi:glycosyltransferase involved in cell wall biosynthesis
LNVLQVNTTVNYSAPGKIAEAIGRKAIDNGYESYIAYGRSFDGLEGESASNLIKIGAKHDVWAHVLTSRLFDRQGFGSARPTIAFIEQVRQLHPDIIHLHNIHGYYLNYGRLFRFLASINTPVVWTMHDCWAFTGHCAYYTSCNCSKWLDECNSCAMRRSYPSSLFADRSTGNFRRKKYFFNLPDNLHIVTPSQWLADEVERSFLSPKSVKVIRNGIDLNTFYVHPVRRSIDGRKVVLGVANVWEERKGYSDFLKLRTMLGDDYVIVLVGVSKKQMRDLPDDIIGVEHTHSAHELAVLYNMADVFVNPTRGDTFSMTNIEALACGTPVVTYDVGGAPETVDEATGCVVAPGSVSGLCHAIHSLEGSDRTDACRARAERYYNADDSYAAYIDLYNQLLK